MTRRAMAQRPPTRQPVPVSPLSAATLQRKCAGARSSAGSCHCDACAKDRTGQAAHDRPDGVPPIVRQVLDTSGQPLDSATRGSMEARFGHDFGRVRVHADGKADASARAVGASAYAVGPHIVFARGQYAPATRTGAMVLAHELTHVLQQPAPVGSTGAGPAEIRLGEAGDAHEREADSIAARVMSGGSAMPAVSPLGTSAPGRLMRKMGPELDPPPPRKPDACEPFVGPPQHPEKVSETMIDRWKGKYAKEGDQGEGCIEHPYVAGTGETVCTIGYGHQIPGCTVLNKAGAVPTAEERKTAKVTDLTCACSQKFDCKGSQADEQLRKDASGAVSYVHKQVHINLDQAQFDALVDLTLHHGSIPKTLLDALHKYWCSAEGMNYVRDMYLETALTRQGSKKVEPGFVSRREHRVWPSAS
jgi:GH24 family phage-related lysozyme (muramidase)